jgi:precorrin-6A synthase
MKRLLVIGVGCGDPELVTMQASGMIAATDVFLLLDKGDAATDLLAARRAILDRYGRTGHRTVALADAARDANAPYADAVRRWHEQRVVGLERLFAEAVGADETAGLLVWGDPSLYDSTLRIVDEIRGRGRVAFAVEVAPGISSVQLLAARHRIPLHRVGGAVHITTGRNLAECGVDGLDDIVVMLDGTEAFLTLTDQPFDIFWGAYLGTSDELLVAGPIADVAAAVARARREARERKGWIFDIYYLRRRGSHQEGGHG